AIMGTALYFLMPVLADNFTGNVIARVWSLTALVMVGVICFFGSAYLLGALDKDLLGQLRRKKPAKTEE
ncbi:MAG: murein biosynthesis integral membrane protein MurJ, partial [Pontixanthobacter sp.]